MARRRRDASLTVAICLSLVAHGGLGLALLEGEASAARRRIAQPPTEMSSAVSVGPVLVAPPPERKPEPLVKPAAEEKLPKVSPLPPKEPAPAYLKSVFGEAEGKGDAEHASPGEEEMRATRKAPENQAFLSRDPLGPGRVGDPPSRSTSIASDGRRGKSGEVREGKAELEKPFGVPSERVEAVAPRRARKVPEPPAMIATANPSTGVRPVEGHEGARDAKDVAGRKAKPAVAVATARQEKSGGASGNARKDEPAADPAPMSDSEADAFGKVVNVEFRNGRMEAQTGRRVKTVRPKLLLSAQYELLSQDDPRVLLTAKVDATGHVTKVDIYQSSGTPDLDQPCLVALYDWWFEPPKDKKGKPMPDVVVVAITFRTK